MDEDFDFNLGPARPPAPVPEKGKKSSGKHGGKSFSGKSGKGKSAGKGGAPAGKGTTNKGAFSGVKGSSSSNAAGGDARPSRTKGSSGKGSEYQKRAVSDSLSFFLAHDKSLTARVDAVRNSELEVVANPLDANPLDGSAGVDSTAAAEFDSDDGDGIRPQSTGGGVPVATAAGKKADAKFAEVKEANFFEAAVAEEEGGAQNQQRAKEVVREEAEVGEKVAEKRPKKPKKKKLKRSREERQEEAPVASPEQEVPVTGKEPVAPQSDEVALAEPAPKKKKKAAASAKKRKVQQDAGVAAAESGAIPQHVPPSQESDDDELPLATADDEMDDDVVVVDDEDAKSDAAEDDAPAPFWAAFGRNSSSSEKAEIEFHEEDQKTPQTKLHDKPTTATDFSQLSMKEQIEQLLRAKKESQKGQTVKEKERKKLEATQQKEQAALVREEKAKNRKQVELETSLPARIVVGCGPNAGTSGDGLKVEDGLPVDGVFSGSAFGDCKALDPRLLKQLQFLQFEKMTHIQAQALTSPAFNNTKHDLLLRAPTGSGKTLAFLLPLVQHLLQEFGSGVSTATGTARDPLARDSGLLGP